MGRVTLTFDNGPHAEITPSVLEVLARHGVKASFFIIGEKLRKPELRSQAERAHDAGHWIGNHSMTHTIPLGEDRRPDAPEREIEAAQNLLGQLSHRDRFFRPFGGGGHLDRRLLSRGGRDYLTREGFTCVL
jgi:peptidoglycan/xylan/chitin deacetylase (PgdA/CDA1 family)